MSTAFAIQHGEYGRAALYSLNRPMATHAHREGHLTFHVLGAAATMTVSGETIHLDAGTAGAVNPWQSHDFVPCDLEQGVSVLVLYIRPAWFDGWGSDARRAFCFGRSSVTVTPEIRDLVNRASTMLLDGVRPELFSNYIYELTRECFEQAQCGSVVPAPETAVGLDRPRSNGVRDYRVRNSMRLIKERVGGVVALDAIAKDAGLSRPNFYKLFRDQAGVTPNTYLNTLRMEAAIDLLTRTDEPVTAIGLDLGFASQPSFTRFFTTNVGIPPAVYRCMAAVGA